VAQRNQVRDPNKTKTGKTRLNGLTISKLTEMAEKENRKKIRAKILNRIRIVTSTVSSKKSQIASDPNTQS
jgi:hypothetical protein